MCRMLRCKARPGLSAGLDGSSTRSPSTAKEYSHTPAGAGSTVAVQTPSSPRVIGTASLLHCPRKVTSFACAALRRNVTRSFAISGEMIGGGRAGGFCARAADHARQTARERRNVFIVDVLGSKHFAADQKHIAFDRQFFAFDQKLFVVSREQSAFRGKRFACDRKQFAVG